MPACLAHDIDFHQCLEITSEPLPGQPASTFSHFCILPLRVFSCFFFFSFTVSAAARSKRGWQMLPGREAMARDGEAAWGGGCWKREVERSGWVVGDIRRGSAQRWMAMPGESSQGRGYSGMKCVLGERVIDVSQLGTWGGGSQEGEDNKTPEKWHQWTPAS